ncbi:hypothetical protein B0T19DRAFT_285510 [Cercophora scortea]|uniref:Ig-like domain-containing protein n=1 Tax=Cercophora scortea TaxID=314031 RepID=A0AAE0I874_9PEZI|nr:hypothetical protein B0T19DRAFT_285510 [Cercophora scortea]
MRHNFLTPVALATASLLSGAAHAARVCGTGTGTFQYRLLDLRYDSPDPSKKNGLSTVAASLGTSTTPLYECVVQWPEAWAGWYEGGSNGTNIIWSDCIWTGAGAGADTTVSLAVDWKKKSVYVAHTFACSDKQGTDGLATGSVTLDITCSTADDNSFCTPKITSSTGARPDIRISTTQLKPSTTSKCADTAKQYQSWRVDKWTRQIEMTPGSTSANPLPLKSDSGPSFVLRNLAGGGTFSCASDSSGQMGSTFLGVCKPTAAAGNATTTTARFSFDTKLDLVTLEQDWDCGDGSVYEAVGVAYMQAACDRRFNSDVFVCTSEPVWVGTATF